MAGHQARIGRRHVSPVGVGVGIGIGEGGIVFRTEHVGNGKLRVRCNDTIQPMFLYYYLQKEEVKQSIRNIAVGATMPSINTKLLSEIQIVAPSKTNQKLIASILSTLDDKIECNRRINDNFAISFLLLICFVLWLLRRINDNLQHQANALFKSWFVDFEPFRNGEFAEAEMGSSRPSLA